MPKEKEINQHKNVNFDKYLEYALSVMIANGYSYCRFPEHTDYYGYIFHDPKKMEIKIPMPEFIQPFKELPDMVTGFMHEQGDDVIVKTLPDWLPDQYYNHEFTIVLLNTIIKYKNMGNE